MQNDSRGTGMNRRRFLNLEAGAAGGTLIAQAPSVLAGPKVQWRADGDGMARIGLLVPSFTEGRGDLRRTDGTGNVALP